MTIHNDNNIQAVTVFEESYSNTFLSICPVLKGFEVYRIDIDCDNIPQEFHPLTKQDFNCSSMTIQWNGKRYIFRSMVICQGYTPEEEIALIAHEFGHIICAVADLHPNNKNNTALEEIFGDNVAHALGLSQHITSALDKLSNGGYDKAAEIAERKLISESVSRCNNEDVSTDTLTSYLNTNINGC